MMYRDDDTSRAPGSHQAMIGGAHQPGDALVVQSNGAPHALAFPAAAAPVGQDVLRGGMDANTFLHALRRRWLLTLCMGLVLAGLAAGLLWYLFPESSSATALFQVANEQQSIVFDLENDRNATQQFETLKKTQLALLKSYFVLNAAIRKPGVASLSALAGEPDPVMWLQENLDVTFPQQGEILAITLAGPAPTEDLVTLVNAVATAYKDEVLYYDQQKRLSTRDLLARSLENLSEEMNRKWEDFLDIAREAGRPQTSERDVATDLLLGEIRELMNQKAELENTLYQAQTNHVIMKSRLDGPHVLEMQVEEALAADPQIGVLQQQLTYYQLQLSQMAASTRGGHSRQTAGLERQISQLSGQINQYRAQMKERMKRDNASKPNMLLQQLTKEFQHTFGALRAQYAGADKALKDRMKTLDSRLEKSTELDNRRLELERLQGISDDMSVKLESLDIESQAPPQIEQRQAAVPMKALNKVQQFLIAAFGGLTVFGLTCLGIGYFEFRNRRLNGPDQVGEGLGIRVIGTLPSLSSRHALDPNHPIVAQLTESIDGVRTILMHDSTSKRRQVVLVTSAATMEGRTTVASQLAASLARAGRRTLLIDGDLRRPALHSLFDVPLEDGLCEVLRAEVDVADVIRPTHAEGLWLLTAGYCDIDAIHALATEQMQPVFDKLRSEYDFVIIDGAPVLGMSDALIFGQYSDGAILSVRRDHSQMPKINHAAELLRDVGIRIIGAVVNGVPAKADDRIIQLRLIAPKSERELQPTG